MSSPAEPKNLTLADKVGQMIIGGWPGPSVTPDVRRLIADYRVGGVSLLPRNLRDARQTSDLCHDLQEVATAAGHPAPLWLAADQEGGAILAVRDGATPFPGNLALGAAGEPRLAYAVGRALAEETRGLGINLNYAPVLDVNVNPRNPIIGVRSFGEDPNLVAALGRAFVEGALAAGAPAVGKHFPGHGATSVDSHLGLPLVERSLEGLEAVELVPFRAAIDAGLPAIMTAHVLLPALDPEYPATLSRRILTGLLRERLGFDGLILTDCLEMEAIAGRWPAAEFAVRAVEAGADLLLISHSLDRQAVAVAALCEAIASGRLSEARLDQSVDRILAAKRRFIHPAPGGLDARWPELTAAHARLEAEVCAAAVTLVRDGAGLLPLRPGAPVTAIWPQVSPRARTSDPEEICPLGAALARYTADVQPLRFSPCPDGAEIAHLADEVADAGQGRTLIVATATARPAEAEAQSRLVRAALAAGRPAIVVALRNPYDLGYFTDVPTCLATYSYHPAAVRALADVLFGAREATGTLPVSV